MRSDPIMLSDDAIKAALQVGHDKIYPDGDWHLEGLYNMDALLELFRYTLEELKARIDDGGTDASKQGSTDLGFMAPKTGCDNRSEH